MIRSPFAFSRRLRLHSARAQRQLVFLLGGVITGAAAVALALLADEAQAAFRLLLVRSRYISLVVTPLGFGVIAYLTRRAFPNAQGSGIPRRLRRGISMIRGLAAPWFPFGSPLARSC